MGKITRQRKWLLGILGAGLVVVVVDRTLLSAPEQANASEGLGAAPAPIADGSVEAAPETDAPMAVGGGPIDLSGFSRRLDELAPADTAPSARVDAFAAPESWVREPLSPRQTSAAPVVGLTAEDFSRRHVLNGTMHDGVVQIAVLDSQPYRVGMAVDGFILRHVASRLAVWESRETGESVVLRESD